MKRPTVHVALALLAIAIASGLHAAVHVWWPL